MPRWELSWQAAAVGCGVLLVVAGVGWRWRRTRAGVVVAVAREASLLLGLFALWQLARQVSVIGTGGAIARGQWIWDTERTLRVPSEASLQRVFLPHRTLVETLDFYYATMHFTMLGVLLVWLFVRHRDRYAQVRTVMVVFTALALLVQLLPVAPPRLVPSDGMVDTAVAYGQSVYASPVGQLSDQYSAMPSIHVGWALLVAIAAMTVSTSRWRVLGPVHAAVTVLVVVVTANHYWADGVVAAVLLVPAYYADHFGRIWARGAYARLQLRHAGRVDQLPAVDTGPARAEGRDSAA